jgi:hypothetical protein
MRIDRYGALFPSVSSRNLSALCSSGELSAALVLGKGVTRKESMLSWMKSFVSGASLIIVPNLARKLAE